MNFLIVNNTIYSEQEANLTSFLLPAPFMLGQTFWFGFGGIPLFKENLQTIEKELNALNRELPPHFKNQRELFRLTKRMLNKNRFYRSGLITFQIFISENKIETLITSRAFSEFDFPINKQGLLITISELKKFSNSQQNQLSFQNRHLWQQIKASNNNTPYAGSVILNQDNRICEGIESNIFMIKDGVLYTPSPETGCYLDVTRDIVIQLAQSLKLKIAETAEVEEKHLRQMDEIFFASEKNGIQWVLGIGDRRFVHEYSDLICGKINLYLKARVEN